MKYVLTAFDVQLITRLIPLMVKAQGTPFAVPPATMATMCKHLYQVDSPRNTKLKVQTIQTIQTIQNTNNKNYAKYKLYKIQTIQNTNYTN